MAPFLRTVDFWLIQTLRTIACSPALPPTSRRGFFRMAFDGDLKIWESSHSQPGCQTRKFIRLPSPRSVLTPKPASKDHPEGTSSQHGFRWDSESTKVWSTSPTRFSSSSLLTWPVHLALSSSWPGCPKYSKKMCISYSIRELLRFKHLPPQGSKRSARQRWSETGPREPASGVGRDALPRPRSLQSTQLHARLAEAEHGQPPVSSLQVHASFPPKGDLTRTFAIPLSLEWARISVWLLARRTHPAEGRIYASVTPGRRLVQPCKSWDTYTPAPRSGATQPADTQHKYPLGLRQQLPRLPANAGTVLPKPTAIIRKDTRSPIAYRDFESEESRPASATSPARCATSSPMKKGPQHRTYDTDTALHKASLGSTVTYWPGSSLALGHYKPRRQQKHPKNKTPLHGSVSLRQRHSLGVTPAPRRDYDNSPGHAAKTD